MPEADMELWKGDSMLDVECFRANVVTSIHPRAKFRQSSARYRRSCYRYEWAAHLAEECKLTKIVNTSLVRLSSIGTDSFPAIPQIRLGEGNPNLTGAEGSLYLGICYKDHGNDDTRILC